MDFYDTLLAHGFRLKEPPIPGDRMRRCKTDAKPKHKNGWYRLSACGKFGYFGDFTNGSSMEWKLDTKQEAIVPRQIDDKHAKALRLENLRTMNHAIAGARKAWDNLSPMQGTHPYLTTKNLPVQGCDHVRIDRRGEWFKAWYKFKGTEIYPKGDLLVIPMYRGGKLQSIQSIDATGKKLFWKDAPTKGCYLDLHRPTYTITIFTEGFATGLYLFQTIPQARVIVCFNADNMSVVAEELNVKGMAVVAADNDHATAARLLASTGVATNPGIEKGTKAAGIIGCGVVWPNDLQGSDWLDAGNEWNSPSRVREAIMRAVRPVRRVKTPS